LGGVAVLSQDLYFRDPELCPEGADFCDLDYLEVDEFIGAARQLAGGLSAATPIVDWTTFRRVGMTTVPSSDIVLIEGMTVFRIPEVFELCDRRLYLAPPMSLIRQRKMRRDVDERGKTPQSVAGQLVWIEKEFDADLRRLPSLVRIVDPAACDAVALALGWAQFARVSS
jgi:uridine kinase